MRRALLGFAALAVAILAIYHLYTAALQRSEQLAADARNRARATITAAVAAAERIVPGASRSIELEVKPAVLREKLFGDMTSGPKGYFDLPEFLVYNSAGEGLLLQRGFVEDELRAALQGALDSPEPKPELPQLGALAADWVHADQRPFDRAEVAGHELVLVEFWAEYCGPCKEQMKVVEAFLAEHPERSIALLKINRDPTKLEDVELHKSNG